MDQSLRDRIVLLLTNGMAIDAAESYAVKGGLDPEAARRVVAEARQRITVAADYARDEQLGKAVMRLDDLYAKSIAGQDTRTALQAQRELNRLLGLYGMAESSPAGDGGDGGEDARRLELIAGYVLPLKLTEATYPVEEHVRIACDIVRAAGRADSVAAARYVSKKERARLREAALVAAGQDIAPLPAVADPARRARADASFRVFCESYFPKLFYLPWSADHLRVIAKIERVVLHDETLAIAMPRGSGKTTLCITAVIWALLTGRHKVALLIGATEESAVELIDKLKGQMSRNRLLEADYPEACYPIRRLGGEARKANGQRYYGVSTQIGWTDSSIVLPTIPNSRCSGAVVRVAGLTAQIRGALEDLADGGFGRPSLVIADDPQTDGSARSVLQTAERLGLLRGAVMGLAAPDRLVGLIVPCTVIQQDDLSDQLLDRDKNPDFRGERTKMLPAWPGNMKLWEEYAHIRSGELASDGDLSQCVEFYRQRSAPALGRPDCWERFDQQRDCATCPVKDQCMDADAVVSWPARKVEGTLSGLHNAMDIWLKVKDAAFAAEYQNYPLRPEDLSGEVLTPDAVCARANGRKRGEVPSTATKLTMFIDVHDKLLFYCICAWEENFTGYVIDYGTFPQQTVPMFAMASVTQTLGRMFPGVGPDGAIQAGLEKLVATYLSRDFSRGAGLCRIDRLLVDSGYKPGIVSAVRHKVGGTAMMLYRGLGIRAARKPMASYQKRPGERHGWFWMIPNVRRTGEFGHVAADVNYWKAAVHRNLMTAPGEPGSLTIFGQAREHELFAQHIANSEFWVDVTGLGRTVREWSLKPSKPDNHWLDCIVGCAAAASILGVSLPGQAAQPRHGLVRKRVSASAMLARRENRQNF